MILINFFIGFFSIFIAPQIYLYYKYENLKYSLVLIYGLIISFSASWFIFLIVFYFNGHTKFVYILSIFITIISLIYLFKKRRLNKSYDNYIIWFFVLIAIFPLLLHIGDGFRTWDAVVSWNGWALELYNNEYNPYNAAYPILLPSVWSLIYKIQGTNQIWWTAQITIFVIPLFTSAIILALYNEYKDKVFIFIFIFIYPYLIWTTTVGGYMDMPVMLIGTLSLVILYAAEINRNEKEYEYYIYAALLLAGVASIIKQAGLIFIVFNLIYIFLHLKHFGNKKRVFLFIFLSFIYFVSFLLLYYQYQSDAVGNLDTLKKLSFSRAIDGKSTYEVITNLWDLFFSYPPNISWLNSIVKPLDLPPITH